MDIRQVREHLGRVKAYYLKNDTLRSLGSLASGLKGALTLPGGLPVDVRGPLREAVQLMARDEMIKKRLPAPLMYQQGQERALLMVLIKLHKEIEDELNSEDDATASARKLRLDHALSQGMRSLEAGRVSEADEYFQQALANYRDEHRMFLYVGRALVEANAAKRAVPYLRKGVDASPDDTEMATMLEKANQSARAAAE